MTPKAPTAEPDPWVPASELRRIVSEAPADAGLLDDLADIRGVELDAVSVGHLPARKTGHGTASRPSP